MEEANTGPLVVSSFLLGEGSSHILELVYHLTNLIRVNKPSLVKSSLLHKVKVVYSVLL